MDGASVLLSPYLARGFHALAMHGDAAARLPKIVANRFLLAMPRNMHLCHAAASRSKRGMRLQWYPSIFNSNKALSVVGLVVARLSGKSHGIVSLGSLVHQNRWLRHIRSVVEKLLCHACTASSCCRHGCWLLSVFGFRQVCQLC